MNCYLHPETPASAFCRSCGRPLCALCQRSADGTIYCQDHLPVSAYAGPPNAAAGANPYVQPPPPPPGSRVPVQNSPGLAFILGWIPGVGAIYNGQYVKGLIHAVIFALIVSVLSGSNLNDASEAFLGIMLAAFVIYMPFEAYHTAKKRQLGVPVDEWSSMMASNRYGSRAPIGPIVLIVIGLLFLLDTLHVLEFREIGRFWPVILIVVGAYLLYSRLSAARMSPPVYRDPAATRPTNGVVETPNER